MDQRLGEIEKKLDSLVAIQVELKIAAAEQRLQELAHQKNIERFWATTWPAIIEKMDNNSTKIVEIEVALARVKTTVMVWGSFIIGLISVAVPCIISYLEKK